MRRSPRRSPPLLLLAAMFCAAAAPAAAQFSVAPRFSLSNVVRVDEADPATLAEFRRVEELIAAAQYDAALDAIDRVFVNHGRKVVRVEPRHYVTLGEYAHMRIAALPAAALEAYRRRVDPLAEAAYRRGIASRDEASLSAVVKNWFCSTWGDDALVALGDLAIERGDYNAARRSWLSLFESPPTSAPSAAVEAILADGSLSPDDRALIEKFYIPYEPPPREPPIAGEADEDEAVDSPSPKRPAEAWHAANLSAWQAMSQAENASLVRIWKATGRPATRLAYPATDQPLAAIRARLILADLLMGATDAAAARVAAFRRLHPADRGRIAGQDVVLADWLDKTLVEAKSWPSPPPAAGWPTFAHDRARTAHGASTAPRSVALDAAWQAELGKAAAAHVETDRQVLQRQPRVGETWDRILASHPAVADGRLFVAYAAGIAAFDLATGRPAWGAAAGATESSSAEAALIYRDDDFSMPKSNQWVRGVPRYTLSLAQGRLIARVGPPPTTRPTESRTVPTPAAKIVVLDISAEGQGRLACEPIEPQDRSLAFDGTPIADGERLYAALRRSDVRPEVLVACYDLAESPPRVRWQVSVAAAETPGSGQLFECTHNLLSLSGDTLYLNTNLGAVAALDKEDGRIRWLHVYPRVQLGDLRRLADTGHFYRDLTPCLLHDDLAIVAPFDSPAIFALDAATGAVRWTTDAAADAIHLLGVARGALWASGDRLYALDAANGKLLARWPEGAPPQPRGMGRGAVVGDAVLWPTRDQLYVFDARPGPKRTPDERQPPLAWSRRGIFGGNIIAADGRLIVVGESKLHVFKLSP